MKRATKVILVAVLAYALVVVASDVFVVSFGCRHAARGVQPDEDWIVLTTRDDAGTHDTVVAGVEVDGRLYVAANHWPRGWYERAVQHPHVRVTRAGRHLACTAAPVSGEELTRVETRYRLPLVVRFLTGFPLRAFLRLEPCADVSEG